VWALLYFNFFRLDFKTHICIVHVYDIILTYIPSIFLFRIHTQVEIIANDQGNRITPSYVAYDGTHTYTCTNLIVHNTCKSAMPMNACILAHSHRYIYFKHKNYVSACMHAFIGLRMFTWCRYIHRAYRQRYSQTLIDRCMRAPSILSCMHQPIWKHANIPILHADIMDMHATNTHNKWKKHIETKAAN